MKKILIAFILFFSFSGITFALEWIEIITREQRWANEEYRYLDSAEWKAIIEKRNNTPTVELTQAQKDKIEKQKLMNEILIEKYYDDNNLVSVQTEENWRELAWPIQKTKSVKGIIIHHTVSDYDNSIKWIRAIYQYHAISNQRGDIWYNYIIWKDWEIFEWRAWGDNVVWAHAKWNNRSTVWIAVLWSYGTQEINAKQYASLKKLSKYLIEKYNIDLNGTMYFHKECIWSDCTLPLTSFPLEPLIWHRDAWSTSCPWDKLYAQVQQMKQELKNEVHIISPTLTKSIEDKVTLNIDKDALFKKLEWIDDYKIFSVLLKIEELLDGDINTYSYIKFEKFKYLLIDYFKQRDKIYAMEKWQYFDDNNQIKVKLSYPEADTISINSWGKLYEISRFWKSLKLWEEILPMIKIDSPEGSYSEITSWDRKPTWDTTWRYNDNKFRWSLVLFSKDNKIVVVNLLTMNDYLKGLWEVSNSSNEEKIKTIIIAARTYATWYTQKARKFEWEWYDASDDPDVFQKYLWYSYEMRSPKVAEIVEKTKDIVINYDWNLIKSWYFSQSDWRTLSFQEYCMKNSNDINYCTQEATKYPFLVSVSDPAWKGKTRSGHWVGISWIWATYFSNAWWTAQMIIEYYYKWVDIVSNSL